MRNTVMEDAQENKEEGTVLCAHEWTKELPASRWTGFLL